MRYLLFFSLLLTLPACVQKAKPRRNSSIILANSKAATDTVLVFQRTPCHGTCPIYTATIFRNGRVAYNGERFVTLMGSHELHLDQATVTAMLDEARRINFNQFAPSYTANVSDLPSTIITVYQPGQQRHRVLAEASIPAPLQGYITYLKSKIDPLANLGAEK
jgi:hypothetical protein